MFNRSVKYVLMALLIAVFVADLALPNAQAQEMKVIKWRMQVLWDAGTLPYKLEQNFAERVKQLTGGRLEITVYPPGGLVPTMQMFDSLQAGMFEMMKTYEGYYMGKNAVFAFTSSLPLGFTDTWQFETWFWELGGINILRDVYAKFNMYYLSPTIYGEEPIHSKFPIRSVEDLKGKKGRFVGLAQPVLSKLGASVSPLPTAEVYSALEKGVVDFADRGGLAANWDAGLQQVAKYIILPGFHQPTTATCFVVNMNAWKALPPDLQAILEASARESSMILFAKNLVADYQALENFRKAGVEVIYIKPEEIKKIRKIAMEVWEEYADKSSEARMAYDSQKSWMKTLGLVD